MRDVEAKPGEPLLGVAAADRAIRSAMREHRIASRCQKRTKWSIIFSVLRKKAFYVHRVEVVLVPSHYIRIPQSALQAFLQFLLERWEHQNLRSEVLWRGVTDSAGIPGSCMCAGRCAQRGTALFKAPMPLEGNLQASMTSYTCILIWFGWLIPLTDASHG